jgi:3-methylcrotonyl-CoA carboxylase alpha subunit
VPSRVRLAGFDREWTLEVAGTAVHVVDRDCRVTVRHGSDDWTVTLEGATYRGIALRRGDDVWVSVEGRVFVFRVSRRSDGRASADENALSVPMPATVVRIDAIPGEPVRAGHILVSLEAMKMELAIRAPRDAVVAAVHCREGELVHPGRPLVELS